MPTRLAESRFFVALLLRMTAEWGRSIQNPKSKIQNRQAAFFFGMGLAAVLAEVSATRKESSSVSSSMRLVTGVLPPEWPAFVS